MRFAAMTEFVLAGYAVTFLAVCWLVFSTKWKRRRLRRDALSANSAQDGSRDAS